MRVFAGIDGGGTRTRVALVREDGVLAGFAEGQSASFADLGLEAAKAELRRLWLAAWRSDGAEPRGADSLFMGMGSVLSEADARTNCKLAVELGLAHEAGVRADNDAWNAHAGGLAGRPGILLISGTGSVCVGRNAQGQTWRAGGWGYRLRDVGSAHALGTDAMIAVTRDADGRGQPTALKACLVEALGLGDIKEIFRRVHHEGLSRSEVAALAPEVVAKAEAGDLVAGQLLHQNAAGLVEMVTTVARKLSLQAPELALTGGLILKARLFREIFLDMLGRECPGLHLARNGLAPVFGAVLLAFQHGVGSEPTIDFLQNLKSTSARLAPES
jgi:N-acetylglucosamine kinase-like BadF-type ATPase